MTGPVPGARAILAALLLFGAALPAMERGLWYAHAGTRVYPDQVVPTTWDAGTGTNIRWKTPLPNWSNGSPLLVRGRLFVLSEPLGYAPLLTCIDADSGERLWQREVDPIACFPEEDRQRLRRLAGEGWAWNRGMTALCNDIMTHLATTFPGYRPRRGKPDPEHVKSVETAFGERLQALGLRFDGFAAGVGGWTTSLPFIDERGPEARREQELHELGLRWERWSHYGTWTGSTYGTPACDGERVFIATGNNHFSCYDLAGELLWQHRFPWPGSRQPTRLIPEAHRPRIGTVPPGDPGRFSSE